MKNSNSIGPRKSIARAEKPVRVESFIPIPKHESDAAVQAEVEIVDLGFPRESLLDAAKSHGLMPVKIDDVSFCHSLRKFVGINATLRVGDKFLLLPERARLVLARCAEIDSNLTDATTKLHLSNFVKSLGESLI